MNANVMSGFVLVLLALAGAAGAQGDRIDTITASPMEDDGGEAWKIPLADLERDYPAVARAVRSPNHLVEVFDDEQQSTQAFFAEQSRREVSAIEVEGARYAVGISIASGLPPATDDAPDAESHAAPDEIDVNEAPGFGAVLALGAVGAAALVAIALRLRR